MRSRSWEIRMELNRKVKERVDKNQRDYILREQLKVIQEELGDGDTCLRQISSVNRRIS